MSTTEVTIPPSSDPKASRGSDHIYAILIAFLAALGCYTAVSILGSDGATVLHDVLVALVGALAGVAVTGVSLRKETDA